jgi:uncharacterized membrane protein
MAEKQQPRKITLSLEDFHVLRRSIRPENVARQSIDSAVANGDGCVSFDSTSEEITAIIADLSYKPGGAQVIAKLIKQGSP